MKTSADLRKHQPREHAVPCLICRRETWNVKAVCDLCLRFGHSDAALDVRR